MTDFEDRLRRELQASPPEPDTAFVSSVDRKIAARERSRAIRLVLASLAAAGLAVAAAFGVGALASFWTAVSGGAAVLPLSVEENALRIAAPAAGLVLLAILLGPAVYSRR